MYLKHHIHLARISARFTVAPPPGGAVEAWPRANSPSPDQVSFGYILAGSHAWVPGYLGLSKLPSAPDLADVTKYWCQGKGDTATTHLFQDLWGAALQRRRRLENSLSFPPQSSVR